MTPNDDHPITPRAHVPRGYSVALVGDIIMSQPIATFLVRESADLVAVLAASDLVVGNFEGSVIDFRNSPPAPAALSGFGWLNSPPSVATDLATLGFDFLSRANNHSTDWGTAGMTATDAYLIAAGIDIAGTGQTLAAARAPAVRPGPLARAALVSFATTFEADAPASDPFGQMPGRAGLNALRVTPIVVVDDARFAQLRELRDAQAAHLRPDILMQIDEALGVVTLMGTRFRGGGGSEVDVDYTVDRSSADAILLNVRQASQTADIVVAACHTHEPSNWASHTPDFFGTLAADAIRSGADIFVAHGPHQLRGIELIDGRPVFHSLGDFCFTDDTQQVVALDEWERPLWHLLPGREDLRPGHTTPAEFQEWQRVNGAFAEDIWFESVVAVVTYADEGVVDSIVLHPIELRAHGRDSERGIPRIVQGTSARRILERVAALSKELGTLVSIEGDVGIIRPEKS